MYGIKKEDTKNKTKQNNNQLVHSPPILEEQNIIKISCAYALAS